MNRIKLIITLFLATLLFGCSEDVMDEINEGQSSNEPTKMTVDNMLPDIMLKSGYETAATDMAWYASVYIEHNAGVWNQLFQADQRQGQESASLMNNSWNAIYDVMNICNTVIEETDPESGSEPLNYSARGVAQTLMAYNLGVTVNMWGDAPYEEAFQGNNNLKPKYDNAEDLYTEVHNLLDSAVANLSRVGSIGGDDFFYGGSVTNWIRAAYALKARYSIMLTNVNGNSAAQDALDAINNSFQSPADNMTMDVYGSYPDWNPWFTFYYNRDHHAVSTTFEDVLSTRNDPRIPYLINYSGRNAAPIGEADQNQQKYAKSWIGESLSYYSPTRIITYHELKFIEAEARFRLNPGGTAWETALQEAVEAAFAFIGNTYYGAPIPDGTTYFTNEVQPRLTSGNELEEIMTQKWIAMFEFRSMISYNDYRRTGYPEMQNPNNATTGFPHRFPYALSETQSNPENVPDVSIFEDKLFWALD
jgi:hypothetical protein